MQHEDLAAGTRRHVACACRGGGCFCDAVFSVMSPATIAHLEARLGRLRRNHRRALDRKTILQSLPETPANRQHIDDETDLIVMLANEIWELEKCLERWSAAV